MAREKPSTGPWYHPCNGCCLH